MDIRFREISTLKRATGFSPAGAKVVAFDLNFLNEKPEDPTFQQALDKYRAQVVIGLNFSDDGTSYQLPSPTLLPSQDPLDDRLGYFNFWKDPNDVLVRTAQYRNNNDYMLDHPGSDRLPILYSMAARVVQKAGDGELVRTIFWRVRCGLPEAFRHSRSTNFSMRKPGTPISSTANSFAARSSLSVLREIGPRTFSPRHWALFPARNCIWRRSMRCFITNSHACQQRPLRRCGAALRGGRAHAGGTDPLYRGAIRHRAGIRRGLRRNRDVGLQRLGLAAADGRARLCLQWLGRRRICLRFRGLATGTLSPSSHLRAL